MDRVKSSTSRTGKSEKKRTSISFHFLYAHLLSKEASSFPFEKLYSIFQRTVIHFYASLFHPPGKQLQFTI